ncbi:MAG: NAD-dependent epimerase/dehydratase family protein [Bacteroidota bacterium]|nr:NAD-dependent epimerase/dehydratase family protein [Bacteroidota bacterium]
MNSEHRKVDNLILVTGGTGLVGSHLLYELTKAGEKVRAIRRPASDTGRVRKIFSYYTENPASLLGNIDWVEADLLDSGALEDAMEGVTEIYHVAGVVSFRKGDHKNMLKTNIEGTANLVDLALEREDIKFCFVSSVSTIGLPENNRLANEETNWQTSRKNSVYSISKYGAEREVWRGIEEGLRAVIVNPSTILGPGFWNTHSVFFKLVRDGMKYYTLGVNGYVDVMDVAKAMILLMNKEIFGERFILTSENLSTKELISRIANHLGKPVPTVQVTSGMACILRLADSCRSFLTGCPPLLTREFVSAALQNFPTTSEKIRKRLDFSFKPMDQSIEEICRLYLQDMR